MGGAGTPYGAEAVKLGPHMISGVVDRLSRSRYLPSWAPQGAFADRLVLLVVALVALRFANWLWLADRVPGQAALTANLVFQYVAFLAFVAVVALCCVRTLPGWLTRLKPGRLLLVSPLLALVVAVGVGWGLSRPISSGQLLIDDANAMAVCGARAIVAGRDPYHVTEIGCLKSMALPPALATPLKAGPFRDVRVYPSPAQIDAAASNRADYGYFSRLGKPPLDPVSMIPVAHAGASARAIWVLGGIVVLLVAVALAAGPLWPVAVGVVLLTYAIPGSALNFAANGNAEAFAYVLMALSVLWIRRPILSAVCLALALGSNELAWFFLPGYFLLCLDLGQFSRRLVAGSVTIAVAVLPWVVRYPDAIAQVWGVLRGPTFPLGYGPIELVLAHVIPPPPRLLTFALTALVMLAVFTWGLARPRWRVAAAVLTLSAFWLNWRSLEEYLAQIPLLALVAVIAVLAERRELGASVSKESVAGPQPIGAATGS